MNGIPTLYVDQYGRALWARTVRELRERIGGGRVSRMYIDRAGSTLHVGYVVGPFWLTAYRPIERQV